MSVLLLLSISRRLGRRVEIRVRSTTTGSSAAGRPERVGRVAVSTVDTSPPRPLDPWPASGHPLALPAAAQPLGPLVCVPRFGPQPGRTPHRGLGAFAQYGGPA